ncbi:hypothetical protein ACFL1I_05975 [Candidatus Omnitrophota bacterium]
MRWLIVAGIALAVFVSGCASNPKLSASALHTDFDSFFRLRPNMSPDEVLQLFGDPERPIEIYFYYNKEEGGLFSRLSKKNYTPLVFVDNKLAGWGWNYLNGAAQDMITN